MSQDQPHLVEQSLDRPASTHASRGWILACAIFLALSALAYFTIDQWLVQWIHSHRIDAFTRSQLWWLRKKAGIFAWPGHFACTLVIGGIIALVRRPDWRPSLLLLLSGVLSGSNGLFKWCFGRARPNFDAGTASMNFDPFRGGVELLFNQKNLAFPSGDTALAVATAACLSFLFPRLRIAWWMLALIVGVQRLAESAHHASDVLAATALGIAVFQLARLILPIPTRRDQQIPEPSLD